MISKSSSNGLITLLCDSCGVQFAARRASARWCSDACKQKEARKRNGKSLTKRTGATTSGERNERISCKHCGKVTYWKGRGRFPKFCSNSCRVSCNRFLKEACIRFLWGRMKGYGFEQALAMVNEIGTAAVEKMANDAGFEYSSDTRRFWMRSIPMAVNDNA